MPAWLVQADTLCAHLLQRALTNRAMGPNGDADDPFPEGLMFDHKELPWPTVVLGVLCGSRA